MSAFAERLLDLCGFPVSNESAVTTLQMYQNIKAQNTAQSRPQPTFNPFRFLAYQRIFFDFYRNTDFTTNEPRFYNIDNSSGGVAVDAMNAKFMFYPQYSLWNKDSITSIKPTPLITNQGIGSVGAPATEGLGNAVSYLVPSTTSTGLTSAVSGSSTTLNISRLRATMAFDHIITALSNSDNDIFGMSMAAFTER